MQYLSVTEFLDSLLAVTLNAMKRVSRQNSKNPSPLSSSSSPSISLPHGSKRKKLVERETEVQIKSSYPN
jgi:hypothetical protein